MPTCCQLCGQNMWLGGKWQNMTDQVFLVLDKEGWQNHVENSEIIRKGKSYDISKDEKMQG